MAALMRCLFLKPRNFGPSFISALSSTNNHRIALPVLARFATNIDLSKGSKSQILNTVHRKIDFKQGISSQLFKNLFTAIETDGSVTEYDVGLLLHICSIGPFNLPSQKRLELVDEIWNKLEDFGVQPSIKLYNIKLKALCANKKSFNPSEELMKMKSLGLNPDKNTHGYLIEGFCQNGDIAGANLVLESMKTAEYPLSVGVFNSFITGHLKAGSPEEAANVLEILRSRNLSPNPNTYLRFALHFAEEGDVDSVLKYIAESEEAGVPLENTMLFDIYRALVLSGHSDKGDQLLQIISEKNFSRHPFIHMACHLAAEGFNESALQLYLIMPEQDEWKNVYHAGSFLLNSMIINGQSADDTRHIIDKIMEFYPKALPHKNALFYAYKADRTDLAIQLLEKMAARNEEIKVQYIIPAICDYCNKNDQDGVYKSTRMLLELEGKEFQEDKIEQLLKCCYPALESLQQTKEDINSNLKEHEKMWNLIFFANDILTKDCATALKNVEGKQIDNSMAALDMIKLSIIMNGQIQKDWRSCLDVLEFVNNLPGGESTDMKLNGDLLSLFMRNNDWPEVSDFLDTMKEKKLKLFFRFKNHGYLANAPDDVIQKVNALCGKQMSQKSAAKSLEDFQSMEKEELEECKKQKPGLFLPHLVLLQRAMKSQDLEDMRQILKELKADNFELSLGILNKIICKLAQLGDVELAKQYFEKCKSVAGDGFSDSVPLNIAAKQVENGDIEGALEMIRCASKSTFPKNSRFPRRLVLKSILQAAPTCEDATRLHSEIFASGNIIAENDALPVHYTYINKFLEGKDDDELLKKLTELHEKFHICPSMDQVLIRFIEKQDVERLKKVMDLGIAVFGSTLFYHKLAMDFIQCGMPARAATVLQSPGIKIVPKHIITGCQNFIKTKRTDCLEAVVAMTKDMAVSRTTMLSQLIEGYVAADDLVKATDALKQYSVEMVKPEKSVIDLLLHAHRVRNMEIPPALQEFVSEEKEAKEELSIDSSSESSSSETEEDPGPKTTPDS